MEWWRWGINAKPLEKNICRSTTESLNSLKKYDKNNEDEKTTASHVRY